MEESMICQVLFQESSIGSRTVKQNFQQHSAKIGQPSKLGQHEI